MSAQTLNRVLKTIKEHSLTDNNTKILVALSGGAESVALTHILHSLSGELNITLFCAHLNHGIRGVEALRDECFAKEFAQSLGIECFVKRVDIPKLANGLSEELVGRNERYKFFNELCDKHSISKIATAHNKNDNAETLVMNFMRGATLGGLSGIPYSRDNIIRPILDLSREEIEEYCHINNLDFVTDSTNLTQDYTRNKIRLSLIPQIQRDFNPNFISTVTSNADYISQDNDFLEMVSQKEYDANVINNKVSITYLKSLHKSIARRIIYKMISAQNNSSYDISSKYTDAGMCIIDANHSGKAVNINNNIIARIEYDTLIISKNENTVDEFEYILPLNEEVYIKEVGIYIKAVPTHTGGKDCFTIPENATIKVRNRRSGDVFFPVGMTGRKKIKEYYTDEKIPVSERNKICLVTFNDEIGYVLGKRRDRRFDFDTSGIKITYRQEEI